MEKTRMSRFSPGIRIYLIAVAAQLLAVALLLTFSDEIPASDPWFEEQALELVRKHSLTVEWENPPHIVQQGDYQNWRPPLYSLIIALTYVIWDSRIALIILQVFLYAVIPVLLYHIAIRVHTRGEGRGSVAATAVLLWMVNPQFVVSSYQVLDTMTITAFFLLTVLVTFRQHPEYVPRRSAAAGLLTGLFYLLRPTGSLTFILYHGISFVRSRVSHRVRTVIIYIAFLCMGLAFLGLLHVVTGSGYRMTYTSAGYNLWLGNNPETRDFMRRTLGDAATIEDRIFAEYQGELTAIARADEQERNRMFTRRAIAFMIDHPVETLENMFWKAVGFWSPFRSREGHFSASWKKEVMVLAYQLPLLLFAFITVVRRLLQPERMRGKGIGTICLLVALWMLPHLLFFATPRFRAPVDPLILYMAVLSLPEIVRSRFRWIVRG